MRTTGDVMDLSEVSTVVPASEEHSNVSASCELNGLRQENRDRQDKRMLAARADLDRVGLAQFVCTPYDDPAWDPLRPAWMLTVEEQLTW
ncbi:hypothetical protein PIB30_089035 [Stylosanthes scabra]|uniref:Uncharacterized protein n=1 Tax=Stylosanthes scabra TaxID=79078 RepID=A0ABU6ZSN6_9FABA|nr:hypothetical protein [Stylosanthes scabra]